MISHPTIEKRKRSIIRGNVVLAKEMIVMTMNGLIMMATTTGMVEDWNQRLMNLKTGLEIAGMLEVTIGPVEDQDPNLFNHSHLIPKAVMTNTTRKRRSPKEGITINRPTLLLMSINTPS